MPGTLILSIFGLGEVKPYYMTQGPLQKLGGDQKEEKELLRPYKVPGPMPSTSPTLILGGLHSPAPVGVPVPTPQRGRRKPAER